jgi:uncharacterized protein HemX
MPERCKQCQRYEKSLKELRERRSNLWRRGELTDAAAEKLAAEDQQIAEELKKHQATQHSPILTAKTLAIDWLRAEAEITAKNAKTAAA